MGLLKFGNNSNIKDSTAVTAASPDSFVQPPPKTDPSYSIFSCSYTTRDDNPYPIPWETANVTVTVGGVSCPSVVTADSYVTCSLGRLPAGEPIPFAERLQHKYLMHLVSEIHKYAWLRRPTTDSRPCLRYFFLPLTRRRIPGTGLCAR